MIFKLTLNIDRTFGDCLPFNYQYEQSAVIYHILAQADKQYSSWLHENGYVLNGAKRFKLFAYSPFIFNKVKAMPQAGCLNIISEKAVWYINFIPEKSTTEFIQGVFANQRFTIGNKQFKVAFDVMGVEVLSSPPITEEMCFQTLSPVCVKFHENGKIKYLSPSDPLFAQGIKNGLLSKYESLHNSPFPDTDNLQMDFVVDETKKIKSKVITIKAGSLAETKVKGYLFSFRMKMPKELMEIAIEGGIGEQCSQGFGYIKIKKGNDYVR